MSRRSLFALLGLAAIVTGAVLSMASAAAVAPHLPDQPYRYAGPPLPPHFNTAAARALDNTPPDNPLTDAGATLGRVLFYDTRLSANNTVSCGSCHLQARAFADGRRFSRGFAGALTDRRAMPLVDLRYYERGRFFWDERAGSLEEAVLLPIENRIEMGRDLSDVVAFLSRDRTYPALFDRAFGDRRISEERIGRALAQFVRSMVSYRSRYDEGRARAASASDSFDNFTRQENRGKALFLRNCATCHLPVEEAHFFLSAPANTGLDGDYRLSDGGVGDVSLRAAELGAFKSPSLRNVEVAGPYMHDGRFETLEAVVDHYSDGMMPHPNRDPRVRPLRFTASEQAAVVAFLRTLTDRAFLTDPKFSDPFRRAGEDQ